MNRALALLFIPMLLSIGGCAQEHGNDIAVAFYNCENFFDITDNPVKNDDEFTPTGKYHYTQAIYEKKLHNIAAVIQHMGSNDGPAILGMAEVENSTVLNDLVHQPELARRNYKYEWFDGPDPRGINVALLYNPAQFKVLKSEPLHVDLSGTGGKSITRDVLHVYGILDGDTVHVFVNHWPSRLGGVAESSPKRAIAAKVNRDAIDKYMATSPGAKAIIMGDLNDNPTDNSIVNGLRAKASQSDVKATDLFDPWTTIYTAGGGTEVYKHQWNLFDQIIISGGFLQKSNHRLHFDKAEVYKPGFIVDTYKGHEGEPHRSFKGTYWINGYSDHFPVVLYLKK